MNRSIIGLAPDTSLNGVDAVLLTVQGIGLDLGVRLVHAAHVPYPRDLRSLMLRLGSESAGQARHLSLLDRVLGEILALAARQVADESSLSLREVFCTGFPRHCVWQDPDARYPSLLESGMAAIVAERTGLTVVTDFRSRDLAAGGLGTPIEALADFLLFRNEKEDRAVIHLGGIATLVGLPAGGGQRHIAGLEAGPCNLLLDQLMRHLSDGRQTCDPAGKHAVQGRCLEALLETWLEHPYWQRKPPKAMSPAVFGDVFAAGVAQLARQRGLDHNDLLCTGTHLVARGIALGLRSLLPDGRLPQRVLLSGSGVRNGLLWQLLEQQLPGTILDRTDSLGVPAKYRRALAFGILAALTLDGVPGNVPSATGASGARHLGNLTPGSANNWARCLTWMAQQTGMAYRAAG
jgi:anhydro-N-acetylmuramic acid kinase